MARLNKQTIKDFEDYQISELTMLENDYDMRYDALGEYALNDQVLLELASACVACSKKLKAQGYRV